MKNLDGESPLNHGSSGSAIGLSKHGLGGKKHGVIGTSTKETQPPFCVLSGRISGDCQQQLAGGLAALQIAMRLRRIGQRIHRLN
jgi:hypothetical protein